jgi:myo-inositol 2-dehydrogenase/D-chiro-inositol 1-dehydrogenase
MSFPVNVGLIGAGRIGQLHAAHLAYRIPQANILAVADIILEAAQKCATDCDIPTATRDHRAIMENADVDAVIICSSTDTHAQMIEEAAAAGKHIFCEKPIALDLARIEQALAAVEKTGVKLQVGFNRRFDANYRRVRQAVEGDEIGQPYLLHIVSRDPAPPPIEYIKVSGGIFLDMMIHDFDMARFLIGHEVEEIYAAGDVMVDPAIGEAGDIDTAVVTLRFENGVIGTIDNSRQAVYGYDQRVEVFGSGGSISISNNYPNTATVRGGQTIHRDLPLNFFMDRYVEAYIAELETFITCIQEDTAPPVTGRDGRIPVIMGYAARQSCKENRPVKLSEIAPVL